MSGLEYSQDFKRQIEEVLRDPKPTTVVAPAPVQVTILPDDWRRVLEDLVADVDQLKKDLVTMNEIVLTLRDFIKKH